VGGIPGIGGIPAIFSRNAPLPPITAPALRRPLAGARLASPVTRPLPTGALAQSPALARPQSGALLQAPTRTTPRARTQ
ncbi:hypothetical protein, partial [Burkholderia contaminans]